jgi:peptidoglycan/xylan/chitin deacetylase (PgdA/CDA1 family)
VTLYVATSFIEQRREFPDHGRPLSWSALRDAHATGLVEVGSHTHTHALLDRLPDADVDHELDRSTTLIADRIGARAEHFAYPKAVPGSPAADAAVRARFASAALAGCRANVPRVTDVHRLARSPVQKSDGMRWFARKVQGGMGFEDVLRSKLNRRRYAGATT